MFRVSCQHGTYIRKLCTDIGEYLGINSQMIELRRTKAGPISEDNNIISLDKLRNLYELFVESGESVYEEELRKYLRPMEELLVDYKQIVIKDSAIESISHGCNLAIPGILKFEKDIEVGETLMVYSGKGELVAVGETMMDSDEIENNQNGYCLDVKKVFINY